MIQTSPRSWTSEQRQHGERGERVDDQQQRAAADAVHQQPAERRSELRRDDAQEHQPAAELEPVRSFDPQAEREPQRGVAEQAERLAGEEQTRVAVREHAHHTRYAKREDLDALGALGVVRARRPAVGEALEQQLDDLLVELP